jgi:hypothetical protein
MPLAMLQAPCQCGGQCAAVARNEEGVWTKFGEWLDVASPRAVWSRGLPPC